MVRDMCAIILREVYRILRSMLLCLSDLCYSQEQHTLRLITFVNPSGKCIYVRQRHVSAHLAIFAMTI